MEKHPTNLAIWSCEEPKFNNDYYKIETLLEPNINLENITNKDINKLKIKEDMSYKKIGNSYISPNNPKMKILGGGAIGLDKRPLSGEINIDDIYKMDLSNYGGIYKDYSNISAGDIKYYLNPEMTELRNRNIFSQTGITTKLLYKNPQNTIKPYYLHKNIFNNNNKEPRNPFELRDSQHMLNNREELMTLQMNKMNSTNYEKRFF